jgi:hypothetical protein
MGGVNPGQLVDGGLAGPSIEQLSSEVSREIEAITSFVDGIARQFPQAGPGAQAAKAALAQMLQDIVATLQPAPGSEMQPPPLP